MTEFGSIISGTMRSQDLIPVFASELEDAIGSEPTSDTVKALIFDAERIKDYDSEDASMILNELFDALNEYAPAYGYFGSHPGDGADYGYWLSEDFQQDMADNDVLQVSDLSDVPDNHDGEVLVVNDHGNATFGYMDGEDFKEVWAVV